MTGEPNSSNGPFPGLPSGDRPGPETPGGPEGAPGGPAGAPGGSAGAPGGPAGRGDAGGVHPWPFPTFQLVPAEKKKKRRWWLIALIVFALLLLLGRLLTLKRDEYTEKTVRAGQDGEPRILLVRVNGPIGVGGLFGGVTAEQVCRQLRHARSDRTIGAVLLCVSSPGGGVTASDTIWHEILETKKSGLPVLAFLDGMAASGGYYVAAPADRIVASPTTMVGSIGVIFFRLDVSRALERLGISDESLKVGELKYAGSMTRAMSEEEREMLQGLLDSVYDRFVSIVAEGRGMPREKVLELADGRIFTAEEAKENGLIDETGYFKDAVAEVRKLAKSPEGEVVTYRRRHPLASFLTEARAEETALSAEVTAALAAVLRELAEPRFEYRWRPGAAGRISDTAPVESPE